MFSAVLTRDTRDDVVEPAAGMLLSAESSTASRALGGQVGFMPDPCSFGCAGLPYLLTLY
jgi:hypothetical protein